MIRISLLGQSANLVVSAPEVTDQYPLEYGAEDLLDNRRCTPSINDVITELLGGKTP